MEAVRLCNSDTFDAVLTDVNMPRMDGHQLVRWIAANRPGVPFALMSSTFNIDCDECPVSGQCLLLRKPFFPRDVVDLLKRMLGLTYRREGAERHRAKEA